MTERALSDADAVAIAEAIASTSREARLEAGKAEINVALHEGAKHSVTKERTDRRLASLWDPARMKPKFTDDDHSERAEQARARYAAAQAPAVESPEGRASGASGNVCRVDESA